MRQVSRPHISLTAGISSAVCPPRPSPLPAKPENAPLRVDFLEETGTHYLKISGSMLGLLNTFWRSTCSCKMLQNVTDLYNIYIYTNHYKSMVILKGPVWIRESNYSTQNWAVTWHGRIIMLAYLACLFSPYTKHATNAYKSLQIHHRYHFISSKWIVQIRGIETSC